MKNRNEKATFIGRIAEIFLEELRGNKAQI